MEVFLKEISTESRSVFNNLLTYYLYDMSEYTGWSPDENGLYIFPHNKLDIYWEIEDHKPYFIYVNSFLAGFVLIRKYPESNSIYDIGQFFILRKFKGQGIGKKALKLVVDRYPGKWQIRVLPDNSGALEFWRSAVFNIVGDNYQISKDKYDDIDMDFIHFEKS